MTSKRSPIRPRVSTPRETPRRTATSRSSSTTPSHSARAARCVSTRRPDIRPTGSTPCSTMLHGLGNTSTEWTQRARAPQIVDNLLADGKIQPLVMVFPSGDAAATAANGGGGRAQEGYGEKFTQDFLKDIIPYVDSHYSVLTDRKHRALGGM